MRTCITPSWRRVTGPIESRFAARGYRTPILQADFTSPNFSSPAAGKIQKGIFTLVHMIATLIGSATPRALIKAAFSLSRPRRPTPPSASRARRLRRSPASRLSSPQRDASLLKCTAVGIPMYGLGTVGYGIYRCTMVVGGTDCGDAQFWSCESFEFDGICAAAGAHGGPRQTRLGYDYLRTAVSNPY